MGPDKVVLVPAANYTMIPTLGDFVGLRDVTLWLEGVIVASDDAAHWPNSTSGDALNLFQFNNCTGITINGTGIIEGQGYTWWWRVILTAQDNRPHLLCMWRCVNTTISGWTLRNSPQYHMLLDDMSNLIVEDITIFVDVEGQREILGSVPGMLHHGARRWLQFCSTCVVRCVHVGTTGTHLSANGSLVAHSFPTFPLNTDGIDVAGRNSAFWP